MRYLAYLLAYILIQIFAYLLTPIISFFWEMREGWCDNRSYMAEAPRLKKWLWWADTPDNSLMGDSRWMANHSGGYWSKVGWLYRNSLYGFKWSVMAMPVTNERKVFGDTAINHHTGHCGALYISQPNGAWQFKMVMPWNDGYSVLNFGWLLDDTSQERALWMFSPRFK